jgi:UDP-glucose 4-epimerase
LTREECLRAYDMGNFFRVPADNRDLNYEQYFEKGMTEPCKLEQFTSDNATRLSIDEIKKKLLNLEYIQDELQSWKEERN